MTEQNAAKPGTSSSVKNKNECLACRKRGITCDGTVPQCSNCLKYGRSCQGLQVKEEQYERQNPAVSAIAKAMKASKTPTRQKRPVLRITKTTETIEYSPSSGSDAPLMDLLGAARRDPFDSFCVKNISRKSHLVLDVAITTQWSIFGITPQEHNQTIVKKEVMDYTIHSELSYYTTMFSAFCHHAFYLENSEEQLESQTTRLWLKQQITQKLLSEIKETGKPTNEVLMGMFILGTHGGGESMTRPVLSTVQRRKRASQVQNHEYWCEVKTVAEHVNTFFRLVADRGGIFATFNPTLRAAALMFDTFNAWRNLSRPLFPNLAPLAYLRSAIRWTPDEETLRSCATQRLQRLCDFMPQDRATKTLRDVIEAMKILIDGYEQVDRTRRARPQFRPDETILRWIRGFVMYELLSLPDRESQSEAQEPGAFLRGICRLGCLMFIQVEICPVLGTKPNHPRQLVQKVAPYLTAAYSSSEIEPDLLLWFSTMVIMLAYEDWDMTGDLTSLNEVSPELINLFIQHMDTPWEQVTAVMSHFLWKRPECNLTGKDAWNWARSQVQVQETDDESTWMKGVYDHSMSNTFNLQDRSRGRQSNTEEILQTLPQDISVGDAQEALWQWVTVHSPNVTHRPDLHQSQSNLG